MIYLTLEDLTTDSYERFIQESGGDDTTLTRIEARAIDYAKTMLQAKFDVALIFDQEEPVKNALLVEILSKIVLFKLFSRNAARKTPTDLKESYDWALNQLEKINTGRITPDLPLKIDSTGNPASSSMFGNLTNPDFYI
jgi:hypothetical protein